jgi:platelet-activating factor acetylhydrolase
MWCFHKPSEEELRKWIEEEERGEKRIDEDRAIDDGNRNHNNDNDDDEKGNKDTRGNETTTPLRKERTWGAEDDLQEALYAQNEQEASAGPVREIYHEDEKDRMAQEASRNAKKEGASANTWVGILPAT